MPAMIVWPVSWSVETLNEGSSCARRPSATPSLFLVVIGSELYGDSFAIARNVSAGGILVEMTYAPPLGTVVTVHFQHARSDEQIDEIVARAEVKHHHYLNFTGSGEAASSRAIGLRFIDFVDAGERVDPARLH